MSLRTRLLLAFAAVVLIPICLLAFGLRQDMTRRLSHEYQFRVDTVVETIREDLARESASIGDRLQSLAIALANDNRFRLAAIAGADSEREYLLDYAGTAMRLTGLSMLQIHDRDGRVVSSGHFRNEHGSMRPGMVSALLGGPDVVLVSTRRADGEFLALARAQRLTIAGLPFTIVGGMPVDEAFLVGLARDRAIVVALRYEGGALPATGTGQPYPAREAAVGRVDVPLIRGGADAPVEVVRAQLEVTQPLTPLRTLLRSADSWFVTTAVSTGIAAMLLAVWVSSRISRPLATLAEKTAVLDLDRLDVEFDPGTDEVGTLSRLLGDLAARLRTSTVRVREAERRATLGDLSRQVNHDIKNGLIPLRNVMRHLTEVERDEPSELPRVFGERRNTIDSSIAYLETLATSYQKLSPPLERRESDINALIDDVVRGAQAHEHVEIGADLAPRVPRILADPVALRRILENLMANAVDSLESKPGRITVSTRVLERNGELPAVRLTVADTGRGLSREEAGQMFTDFYTTKPGGTGLGLSIVRRLVMDLRGTMSVESEPGKGTRIIVDIPGAAPRPV